MSEQLKEAIENFDSKQNKDQLREAMRQTVRETVDNSVINEQVLTEGVIDAVKNFFSKNDEVKTIFMRGGQRVAVLSFSEGSNEYAFSIVDKKQNKQEESGELNSKSEIKEKQKELKEQGFEVVNDKTAAKRIASTLMKIAGVISVVGGIIVAGLGGFLLISGGGAAAGAAASSIIPSTGAVSTVGAANLTGGLIDTAAGIWVIKRSNERKDKLKRDKQTRKEQQ